MAGVARIVRAHRTGRHDLYTCTAYGMEVSTDKSKIMTTGTVTVRTEIHVRGENHEQVDSSKYLRIQITEDGRSDMEIESRLAIASSARNCNLYSTTDLSQLVQK